jgi:hypothetical protein
MSDETMTETLHEHLGATENRDVMEILRERQRAPYPCEECGEPTRTWDADRAIVCATSCRCQRRRLRHRAYIDNGIPEAYFDTDLAEYVEKAEGLVEHRVTALIGIRDRYIAQLPRLLSDDGGSQRIRAIVNGKEKRFNSLVVHVDDIEVARHFATDVAKSYRGPKIAYFSFPEIIAVIGDFSRTEEQRDLTYIFRTIPLLVIDGVERGRYNEHITQRWAALITQRQFSGKPTVVVALDDPRTAIPSRQWHSFVDDALMVASTLRASIEETRLIEPLPLAERAVPLTDADAIEEAILTFVRREGTPVYSKIVPGINADKALVGKVLDSLVAEEVLEKTEKVGKNGTFMVYQIREEAPKGVATSVSFIPVEQKKSLGELVRITGRPKTTLHRWRSEGFSDEEIIKRAATGG